jgi:hypothetical protein
MQKVINFIGNFGVIILIAFIIFCTGYYFGSHANDQTISKLNQQLKASQSRLTESIADNTKIKAKLAQGASTNQAAHATVGRISDINTGQSELIGRTEECNINCTKFIDSSIGILQDAGKGNSLVKN